MNAPLRAGNLRDARSTGIRADISPSIGQLLVDAGHIDVETAEVIARAQRQTGLAFGEAAIHLKMASAADVNAAVSRQFEFPHLRGTVETVSPAAVAAFHPSERFAEQMRSLRTQLVLHSQANPRLARSIAVFGTTSREGRTFVAANLAVVYSQMGARVLLIDGDLRNPSIHRVFSAPRLGLSNVLLGRAGLETSHPVMNLPGLSILSAGTAAPNPQELLLSNRFVTLMREAVQTYDVVIVDTPPAKSYADAQIIAARVGMGVVVARRGCSDAESFTRSTQSFARSGASLVGTVFNDG